MKKIASVLAALFMCAGCALAAPDAAALKRMSTFLSNFTEQGFFDFDLEESTGDDALHLGGDPSSPDLIRFGIMHNYINNFKSRVKNCAKKDCPHGSLTIEAKFVAESVRKYFGVELRHHSVTDSDPPYHYDGRLYHFEGADGETVYYADVKKAVNEGGAVRMTGDIYNAEDKADRPWTFEALARPYKWKGKDTWAIISMRTKER